MTKKYIVSLLFIVLFSSLSYEAHSQVNLELRRQGFYQTHINVDRYPSFTLILRASDGGSPVKLQADEIVVFEDNRPVIPSSITLPDAEGWQRIEWNTTLLSKTDTAMGDISTMNIFATFHNQSVAALAEYRLPSVSIVNILDLGYNFLYELNMGIVLVGESVSKSLKISPQSARMHFGSELKIAVDSITIGRSEFRYFDVDGPPFMLTSPFVHDADIIFRPSQMGYLRDKMTVYYDRGRRKILNLIAGTFKIEKNTYLTLIQPNGGELLTPCQVYEIKWKGSVRGLYTKIEYTTDYGVNWKEIAEVDDSTYLWTVPPDISEHVYVRVSQPLQKNNTRNLEVDNIPVTKVAFDSRGDFLLAANRSGMIYEWNLFDFTLKNSYSIGKINFPGEATESKGVLYFNNNTKFVAAYNRFYMYPDNNPDTLAFFDVGTSEPYLLAGVDEHIKDIYTDSKRRFIAVLPQLDNKIYLHSFEDGSLIKTVDFPFPVAAINFSKTEDKAVVVLYNNDVVLLDLPDFNIVKTFSQKDLPQIIKAQISPNGKFIGVACLLPRYQEYTGNRNEAHLIDIATGMIVRTSRFASSNPVNVDFSPTSNIMIIGNEGQPQIAFWNLPEDNYSGSIQGNRSVLTDMKMSPNGYQVASTSFSDDNLTIKSFTYPESDMSDRSFKIIPANVSVDTVLVQARYIGSDNLIHITRKLCNTGYVPVIIDYAKFQKGEHFRLQTHIETDTINPGECLDFDVVYHPLDTGLIRDTLELYSCSGDFKMAFEAQSLPRNITFYTNPIDFGELCVGESDVRDILFAKNNDPVPLKINLISIEESNSDFRILNPPRDTVIPAGGSINLTIEFLPQSVGLKNSSLVLHHSDLKNFERIAKVQGVGIGTDIQTSHKDLRFIPEIPQRTLKIDNLSNNDITIVETDIYPYDNYKLLTPLPQTIEANGSLELTIEWNGVSAPPDTMHILAEPCVNRTIVLLAPYSAQSYLTIPIVEADPNGNEGDAVIDVKFKTSTEHPYDGKRFFESELTINPRIFLPLTVTSDYGEGTLIRNEIINDRRVIGFRIEGDFPESGVVANIRGVAGLAEVDTSAIRIVPGATNWGLAVNTTWEDGLFRLINVCGDRRIIQPATTLHAMNVSPNPASGSFSVEFVSDTKGIASIEVINNLGQKLILINNIQIVKGRNSVVVFAEGLIPGSYNVVVRKNAEFISKQIIIIE
jgi:WD40 repeat protein